MKKTSEWSVYLILMRTNYSEWSLVIHMNLQVAQLWDAIERDTNDYREGRAVPQEMQVKLACKVITTEALRICYVCSGTRSKTRR
jgi:RNA polymerase subunit RPABC4/transcription elongation factor Spt4